MVNMTELMTLPVCRNKGHGQMAIRIGHQTKEQRFCGTWYDCQHPGCRNSVLLPSKELRAQWASMRKEAEHD
jgi:hypothetical protein